MICTALIYLLYHPNNNEQMKTYFISRVNIFDYNFKGFQLTQKNDQAVYTDLFFNEDRLEFKTNIFINVTFPSVTKQDNGNWEWHIYTSKYLPLKYLNRIKTAAIKNINIHVIEVENFNEFYKQITHFPYDANYATVRLDDDDALYEGYVELLNKYKNQKGRIISFPYGHEYYYLNNKKKIGNKCFMPNIALGLAAINKVIYNCGEHSNISIRHNVIYNNTPDVYFLCCSPHCDTKRALTKAIPIIIRFKSSINDKLKKYGLTITRLSSLSINPNVESIELNSIIVRGCNILFRLFGYIIIECK